MSADSKRRTDLSPEIPQLLKPKATAEFLGTTEGVLAIWRCTGRYPDLIYTKIGASVMYDLNDLIRFVEKRKVRRKQPR